MTLQYRILKETEKKLDQSSVDQQLMLCFYENIKKSNFFFFFGYNILTGVFLTQRSSNVGISVRRIVWVMTYCCFTSDIRATEV
jgi:hypothetical protein